MNVLVLCQSGLQLMHAMEEAREMSMRLAI